MEKLRPDFLLNHYTEINKYWIEKNNIKMILSDIDSTLVAHNGYSDTELNVWVEMLKENDVDLILVSNNTEDRAGKLAKEINCEYIGECKKPRTKKIKKMLSEKAVLTDNILFLGDQVFTDIWCGKRMGVRTAMVKSIGEHQPWNIRVKRVIEKRISRKWTM